MQGITRHPVYLLLSWVERNCQVPSCCKGFNAFEFKEKAWPKACMPIQAQGPLVYIPQLHSHFPPPSPPAMQFGTPPHYLQPQPAAGQPLPTFAQPLPAVVPAVSAGAQAVPTFAQPASAVPAAVHPAPVAAHLMPAGVQNLPGVAQPAPAVSHPESQPVPLAQAQVPAASQATLAPSNLSAGPQVSALWTIFCSRIVFLGCSSSALI